MSTPLRYRPGNGTAGMWFTEKFCDRCEGDALYRETEDGKDGCPLLANSMLYEVDEAGYPSEWIYLDGKPTCTAFEEEVTPEIRAERRERVELEKAGQAALFSPLPGGRDGGRG